MTHRACARVRRSPAAVPARPAAARESCGTGGWRHDGDPIAMKIGRIVPGHCHLPSAVWVHETFTPSIVSSLMTTSRCINFQSRGRRLMAEIWSELPLAETSGSLPLMDESFNPCHGHEAQAPDFYRGMQPFAQSLLDAGMGAGGLDVEIHAKHRHRPDY